MKVKSLIVVITLFVISQNLFAQDVSTDKGFYAKATLLGLNTEIKSTKTSQSGSGFGLAAGYNFELPSFH